MWSTSLAGTPTAHILYTVDGKPHVVTEHSFDPNWLPVAIVPAEPGYTVVYGDVEGGKPSVYRDPVVAWAVMSDYVAPITPGDTPRPSSGYGIGYPDGRISQPFDCTHGDEEAYKRVLLERNKSASAAE